MGFRIMTNISSVTGQRHMRNTRLLLDQSLERLSSGYRINKAGDDAAGLAISEKIRAKTRGLMQAQRNANDGISLIQVAEGGLNEIQNILIRMRELGVQAASDTIGPKERIYLDNEYQALKSEADRIANSTDFNGTQLLDGTGGTLLGVHMVGPWATEQLRQGYLAVNWGATVDEVASLIQPHPSMSELFGETVLSLTGRSLH